ncbi:MAG TPA: Ada metal-binding domain-containing protein [Bacillota bacterium]|nr:Ada metal-binding domain-containing protein [Bacillota bacterium]
MTGLEEAAAAAPARTPRLSVARMYAALLAGDSSYNGRFFTGVLTTGIYCLPSCKARKPRRENVRFFPTVEAARAAGLRPCQKCHPDDFARGSDPVLECVEALVAEVRANPAAFADVGALVRRSGFGATRLFELFRQHYHATPAEVLLRARLETAKRKLLTSEESLASIAYDAGFEALSSFHENFRRLNGLTPAAYRDLRAARRFTVALPPGYPLPYLRRALSRDLHSVTERLAGDTYTAAVAFDREPALLRLELASESVQAEVSRGHAVAAHTWVVGQVGLDQDTAGFGRLVRRLHLERLIAGRPELRISQIGNLFDALLWSVIGQQIHFQFACQLRRRLIERAGTRLEAGLYVPPTAAAVAALTPADLLKLQFSRQKTDYVLSLARMVAERKLDLAALRTGAATRVQRTLLAIRGLGPWSVNYLMMRALGFADCLPLGDTGLSSGLQGLLGLDERPKPETIRQLMAVFSPFRSLATAHLWQIHQPIPL